MAPSPDLREWFHVSPDERWDDFVRMYRQELISSSEVVDFLKFVKDKTVVTLLYASKKPEHNHALVLCEFLNNKGQM